MNSYDQGDLVRVAAVFTDEAGTATDPDQTFVTFRTPTGTLTTYEDGVDVELVRDSAGTYHIDIDASIAGVWRVRFYSTGTGQAAETTEFYVEPSGM
jgi:uncharacterized protein YfaS (alpha-2-macroglobulin family)